MKKRSFCIICMAIVLSAMPLNAYGKETIINNYRLGVSNSVYVNKELVETGNTPIYEEAGQIIVPLTPIAKALGYTVTRSPGSEEIRLENGPFYSVIRLGSDSYVRANKEMPGMTAPQSYGFAPREEGGEIYVPAQFFELLSVSNDTLEIKENPRRFYRTDGSVIAYEWVYEEGLWYFTNLDGSLKTGWIKWKNLWYYLNSDGSMAVSATTPDGYTVGQDGVWIP